MDPVSADPACTTPANCGAALDGPPLTRGDDVSYLSEALTRKRLDVPEVHALLAAQNRMLDNWSETVPDSDERRGLWQALHYAGDDLRGRAYGGAKLSTRVTYWLRPYDPCLDARVWRWRRPGPCVIVLASAPSERAS